MKVSVIIPTYNGKHRIGNLLEALSAQQFKDFETVIVIDGSTDGTDEFLEQNNFGLSIKVHKQENKGRAAVRNSGASMASGDLLVFFDDDMRPLPDCIVRHLAHHNIIRDSIVTGAQIDDYAKAETDFLRYKCAISRKWAAPRIENKFIPLPLEKLCLTAANFSISRDLLFRLGGFDERLTDAEDFDLAIRAYKVGVPVYFNYDAFAWHDDKVTIRSYIKRLRQYDAAHRKLRGLKPELYKDISLREPVHLSGVKRKLFSLFASPGLLKFVENEKKVLALPLKVRYKLYDLVTNSYGVFFYGKRYLSVEDRQWKACDRKYKFDKYGSIIFNLNRKEYRFKGWICLYIL